MARTHQAPTGAEMTDSVSEVVVNAQSEMWRASSETRAERSESFDACVEDIRRRYVTAGVNVVPPFVDRLRRRMGLSPTSPATLALTGLTGAAVRLVVVLLATALVGKWTGIPWGAWAVMLALFGLSDAGGVVMAPPPEVPLGPKLRQIADDWTALIPTIARESDLRDLADFTRRWIRLPVAAVVGAVVAAVMLAACWLVTPVAFAELPVGSVVLLALVLFEFGLGVVFWGNLVNWAFMARESRYEHQLFWPSPADAPEVRKAMRKTTFQGFAAGLWITVYLVLSVFLVSWDSPLVLPLAVGFIVIGYLAAIGQAFSSRASVRKIVERIRLQRLQGIQRRIEEFGSRYTELTPQESERLRDLLFLHDRIRNAPSAPAATHALARTAAGLLLPTIAFVITVLGEVSAERLLDAILR